MSSEFGPMHDGRAPRLLISQGDQRELRPGIRHPQRRRDRPRARTNDFARQETDVADAFDDIAASTQFEQSPLELGGRRQSPPGWLASLRGLHFPAKTACDIRHVYRRQGALAKGAQEDLYSAIFVEIWCLDVVRRRKGKGRSSFGLATTPADPFLPRASPWGGSTTGRIRQIWRTTFLHESPMWARLWHRMVPYCIVFFEVCARATHDGARPAQRESWSLLWRPTAQPHAGREGRSAHPPAKKPCLSGCLQPVFSSLLFAVPIEWRARVLLRCGGGGS